MIAAKDDIIVAERLLKEATETELSPDQKIAAALAYGIVALARKLRTLP